MLLSEFEKIKIPVVEIFQSISGEGISSGNIVSFVRVAGCNLRCTWCDTKYSFKESGQGVEQLLPKEIASRLKELGSNEVICTGGEPLEEDKPKRYLPLFLALNGFSIHIETGGGSQLYSDTELKNFNVERAEISYCMDIKCPGSGMAEYNLTENIIKLNEGDELKFVVKDKNDLGFSLKIIKQYHDHLSEHDIALNFSPVFDSIKPVEIVDFLKYHTSYFENNELWVRLNLQLHKYVWPPHKRGV